MTTPDRTERTVPFHYSPSDADGGCENGSGVVASYEFPGVPSDGDLRSAVVSLDPGSGHDVRADVQEQNQLDIR